MGFEAFSIVLEADNSTQTLREFFECKKFKVKDYSSTPQARRFDFEYETKEFIVEASLCERRSLIPQTRIECSLCGGNGIDEFFENLVADYLRLFPSEVWFLTGKTKGLSFAPGDTAGVCGAIRREFPALRVQWMRAFGSKRGPVRIAEAYRFVGVPLKRIVP